QRDEVARKHETVARMLPADKRFDSVDQLRAQVELRLIVEHELVLGDRSTQLAEDPESPRVVPIAVPVRLVERVTGSTRLRRVHCDVRVPQQLIDVFAVAGEARNADARLDAQRQAFDLIRLGYEILDSRECARGGG